MNRNKISNIFFIIVSLLLLTIGSVLSASEGGANLSVYLPVIHRPYPWKEVGSGSASGGGISNTATDAHFPSLAFAPDGTPYVAWNDYSTGNNEIYFRRWNGTIWEEVGVGSASGGGISNNIGNSITPSLAIAPDGTPYVAWQDDFAISVRSWNGTIWEEVGELSTSGGGKSTSGLGIDPSPSLAIAPNGVPYLASITGAGDLEIYVSGWDGSQWVMVGSSGAGGMSDSEHDSVNPSLVIASDGTLYVAWEEAINTGVGYIPEIYIKTLNGDSWEEVGVGSASGGGISNNSGYSYSPSLAIGPNGTLYVAWQNGSDIYVRVWNGSGWAEVGAGSATSGGISNNGFGSYPSLSITPDGTPYVAWQDNSNGYSEIYVLTWNGNDWVEVGAGSANDGGISNTGNYSEHPSLAIAPDGKPYVTWEDRGSGDWEIYIRHYIDN